MNFPLTAKRSIIIGSGKFTGEILNGEYYVDR